MNELDLFQGFLQCGNGRSPPPERLAAEFLEVIQPLGFRHFACCSHVDPFDLPAEAIMLHNYPRGWVRTFSEARLFEIDPVLRRAATSPVPFFWDAVFPAAPLSAPQRIVLADAAGYGLAHGYTIPLHLSWLPGGVRASCSVIPDPASGPEPRNYVIVEALANYLYLFASRAHAPWLRPAVVELSRRERECLALVAQGKSDWDIAHLLGIAVSTVHGHIEQAKHRLGVSTRAQAVAQALLTGQITVRDLSAAPGGDARHAGIVLAANLH